MATQKAIVASPIHYPPTVKGYYAQAFKKDDEEKAKLKKFKKLHKKLIMDDYGKDYTPAQLKKIMNPRNIKLSKD